MTVFLFVLLRTGDTGLRDKMVDMYKNEYCKNHDIPVSHLDYPYIEKCNNVKELEKILKVLR